MRIRLLLALVGVVLVLSLVVGAASAHGGGEDTTHGEMDRLMDRCMEMAAGMMDGEAGGGMMDGMMDDTADGENDHGMTDSSGMGCHR